METVKSTVRMVRKGQQDGIEFEVPLNLTEKEKKDLVKRIYKERLGKRAYGFTYEIIN